MTWGIIGTLPEETHLIVGQMRTDLTESFAGYEFHFGTIGSNHAVVVNCGGGKVNAAVCTALLVWKFHADHIISLGVAGALSADLQVLDIVIAENIVFHDVDAELILRQPPYLSSFITDSSMRDRVMRSVDDIYVRNFSCKICRLATGDRFISDDAVKADIVSRTGALCVDMWGASAAQTATQFGVPFTAIRCISDDADEESEQTYEKYFQAAAEQPSYLLLGLL